MINNLRISCSFVSELWINSLNSSVSESISGFNAIYPMTCNRSTQYDYLETNLNDDVLQGDIGIEGSF